MISVLPSGRFFRPAAFACIFTVSAALVGCAPTTVTPPPEDRTPGTDLKAAVGFAQFSDIAVPPGARMNVERTLVFGGRDEWIGRLAMTAPDQSTTDAYDFYLREMPKFGWREITTVRSEVSVQTYSRGGRVATVQIVPKTLGGVAIDITVSPRGDAGPAPLSDADRAPRPPETITRAPLR